MSKYIAWELRSIYYWWCWIWCSLEVFSKNHIAIWIMKLYPTFFASQSKSQIPSILVPFFSDKIDVVFPEFFVCLVFVFILWFYLMIRNVFPVQNFISLENYSLLRELYTTENILCYHLVCLQSLLFLWRTFLWSMNLNYFTNSVWYMNLSFFEKSNSLETLVLPLF